MAVIDKTKAAQQKSTDAEDKQESGKVIDILQDKSLPAGEKRKHDLSEDAWAYSAPPKAGRFSIKLHPAKEFVTLYDKDREGNAMNPIYSISIEGEIVDSPGGEFDKVRVFPRVSTAVGRGKNISTAAGLLHKLGFKVPDEIEDLALARLVCKAVMKEPVTDVEIDWQAYSKEDKRVVYRGMHKFPQDEKGEPQHIVDYMTKSKVIEEIRATLEVTHWYGKGEASKTSATGGASKPAATQTLTLASEPDEEAPPVQQAAKSNARVAVAQAAPEPASIEDELAELEES